MAKKAGAKRKKVEKSKVQLKSSMKAAGKADKKKKVKTQSGIRLPKGLNETKVDDLKIKSVSVRGQEWMLQDEEDSGDTLEIRSSKPLRPLKDILSKIRHHSHYTRVEGLKMFKAFPTQDIIADFNEVLTRVCVTIVDKEFDVRKSALDAITAKFLDAPEFCARSDFRRTFCAHLKCGLAHVDSDVRKDALNLLDRALNRDKSIINDQETILTSVLQELKASDKRKPALHRLQLILESIRDSKKGKGAEIPKDSTQIDSTERIQEILCNFTGWQNQLGIGLKLSHIRDKFSLSDVSAKKCSPIQDRIFPILYECFVDVSGLELNQEKKKKKKSKKSISTDSVEIIEKILVTFNLCIQSEEDPEILYTKNSFNRFTDLMLDNFPYQQAELNHEVVSIFDNLQ